MAKLRVYQTIENDVYQLRFENDPKALSLQDVELMEKFGEPEINIGGTFLPSTGNQFILPDKYIRVRSEFPFVREFDSRQAPFDTNTVTKVIGYRDEIKTRFTTAFTDLRANGDTFTGEQLYNI
jgi:hypothetical protein